MEERIKELMEAQHITQQAFAEFLGISPATLSSIFSGRTKVTLNTIKAIKKKFPSIYDEKLTEFEMMDKTNLLRVWDCGNLFYRMK